jgi:hypothetical protein
MAARPAIGAPLALPEDDDASGMPIKSELDRLFAELMDRLVGAALFCRCLSVFFGKRRF